MITITIQLDETTGQLQFNIPDNALVTFGAMELAKDAFRAHYERRAASGIVVAPSGVERHLALLPNGKAQ